MSYRISARTIVPALAALLLWTAGVARAQSVTVTAAPNSIAIYYLEGATLPSAQLRRARRVRRIPGELVTLFGDNIGPSTAASMTVAGGYVTQTLDGVSVLVDGNPAPMVYVSQHQINIQIPYEVTIGQNKAIVVSNGANPSANGTINLAATSPGIFTVDGIQAAAINTSASTGDTSINSSTAAAHVGDTVSLYVTGEGTRRLLRRSTVTSFRRERFRRRCRY